MTNQSPPPVRAVGIGVGAALVTGVSLGNLGANVMPVVLPGVADRFQLSNTAVGLIATMQLLATALATLTFASRAARPGRVRVARLGITTTAVGFALAFSASDLAVLSLGNILAGAGLGVAYAAGTAAIAVTGDSDRSSAVAVVGGTIVLAALVIALPEANAAWGDQAGFAVMAVCCVPAFWLVRFLPDAAEQGAEPTSRAPVSVMFLLAVALLGASDQGAWSYSAILGEREAGMSADSVSVVLSIASVVSLAGVGIGAFTVRRAGRLSSVAVLIGVEALAKLVIAAVPWWPSYVAAAMIWQICFVGLLVQLLAVAASADSSGRWVAASGGALAIGTGLGPAPSGWFLDVLGAEAFGLVLAVTTAVAAVPVLRTIRQLELGCDRPLKVGVRQ
ncbi:MFS transporter [Streptomyces sp. NPDC004539]|uniref:MFS transporter n=1 Tax=Streptomyces sp. NPDC004539 TaxID=3154280 RepID=UPI0033AE95CB